MPKEPDKWQQQGKCNGSDPELFFPDRDKATYRFVAAQAKAICYGRDGRTACPVLETCLEDAIDQDEPFGIRGGLSHRERNALVRKRTKMRA
jgi:WhiB family redox-sensing transcriptional regulator